MNKIIKNYKNYHKLYLFQKNSNISIGNIMYGVYNENIGFLNSIYVNKNYRGNKYGEELIREAEEKLICDYNINNFKIVVWQNVYENGNLISFFKRNGYKINGSKLSIYDDGYNFFNIIPMMKNIQ